MVAHGRGLVVVRCTRIAGFGANFLPSHALSLLCRFALGSHSELREPGLSRSFICGRLPAARAQSDSSVKGIHVY